MVSALEGGVNNLQLSSSCLSHGSGQKPSADGLEPWRETAKEERQCEGNLQSSENQSPLVSCPFSSIIRQWLLFLRYEIFFKQHVGTEDVFFGMTGKDPSTACCEDIVVSWAWSSHPFFVLFLCPFPSSHLFDGQNVNIKLYRCFWPPVVFSCGSPKHL